MDTYSLDTVNNSNNISQAKPASESLLSELHSIFAITLLNKLRDGDIKPSELNIIRQFLKDNSIECIGEFNNTLIDLSKELPVFNSEDE